jgi:hypothetical protein
LECSPDGRPARLRRAGRSRRVTHIAATWVQPALWWREPEGPGQDPTLAEREYYRLVCDGTQVYEVFRANGQWFLDRIID